MDFLHHIGVAEEWATANFQQLGSQILGITAEAGEVGIRRYDKKSKIQWQLGKRCAVDEISENSINPAGKVTSGDEEQQRKKKACRRFQFHAVVTS